MASLWSNDVLPGLYASGAIGSDLAAGRKTLARIRWLIITIQLGTPDTIRRGMQVGNGLLIGEDMFGESEAEESESEEGSVR